MIKKDSWVLEIHYYPKAAVAKVNPVVYDEYAYDWNNHPERYSPKIFTFLHA
jgi:hypothetical protein